MNAESKLPFKGIEVLFAAVLLTISLTLDVQQAVAASIDGQWVGRGERTMCGNSQGAVDVSMTIRSEDKQAGCPDCLPTTYATIVVSGESSNQTVSVSGGAINSWMNNIGSNELQSWYLALSRWGNPLLGYRYKGTMERMNYNCRSLGSTGDTIQVELHRP